MVETENGLAPGADLESWLADLVAKSPQIGDVTLTEFDTLIDSSNATPADWQALVDALWARRDDADGFVILHGTDTMAYSSAALSYALRGFGKPVAITGSQLPLGAPDTDATANVVDALMAVSSGHVDGVVLVFGRSILNGASATKWSSWNFEGFTSPNAPVLATTGAPWHWASLPEHAYTDQFQSPQPYRRHDVVVLDLVPGITADRVSAVLEPRPRAVILRSYGTGNIPADEPGLVDALNAAAADGTYVIVCSQCAQGTVALGHYEAGFALGQMGAISGLDMTFEACYAKTIFLLSQNLSGDEFKQWMETPMCGELTPVDQ